MCVCVCGVVGIAVCCLWFAGGVWCGGCFGDSVFVRFICVVEVSLTVSLKLKF